jgi:hypothetical protein
LRPGQTGTDSNFGFTLPEVILLLILILNLTLLNLIKFSFFFLGSVKKYLFIEKVRNLIFHLIFSLFFSAPKAGEETYQGIKAFLKSIL